MVAGQNIAITTAILVGMGGIFLWMRENNLSTKDVTLSDACRMAAEKRMTSPGTCEDIDERALTWTSKIPCSPGFKEDTYFYTMGEIAETEEWSAGFVKVVETCQALIRADPDFENRNEIIASTLAGRSTKRSLWGGGKSKGPKKPFFKTKKGAYKSCSLHLGLRALGFVNIQDWAECSGNPHGYWNHPDQQKPYCWHSYYNGRGRLSQLSRDKSYLALGCVKHDICLQMDSWKDGIAAIKSQPTYYGTCGSCDMRLRNSAMGCILSSRCTDSEVAASTTAVAMDTEPNAPYDEAGMNCNECYNTAGVKRNDIESGACQGHGGSCVFGGGRNLYLMC